MRSIEQLTTASAFSNAVRELAAKALLGLPRGSPGYLQARRALRLPMNYMRCAELPAACRFIALEPGMSVLDVSSPQWLSLVLAAAQPAVRFTYVNILEDELAPFREIAQACGFAHIDFVKADVRRLAIASVSVDAVISVSVIEHVYPEVGGDLQALAEMARILKPAGRMVISVPFKDKAAVVYVDGAVYERGAASQNFYAREYDKPSFAALLAASGLCAETTVFIVEHQGLGAVDYWEWGPGRATLQADALLLGKRGFERILRRSVDPWLASRYLAVSDGPRSRVVNVVARLAKSETD